MTQMTVNRSRFTQAVRDKRTEIEGTYNQVIEEARKLTVKENRSQEWADYYTEVAKRVAAGTATIDSSGKVKGGPKRPRTRDRWHIESLQVWIENAERERDFVLDQYDALLQMLDMAEGDTVQVEAEKHQALLSGITTTHSGRYSLHTLQNVLAEHAQGQDD